MKKLLFAVVLLLISTFVKAQIPNNGFESWTGTNPDQWSTLNSYTSAAGVYTAAKLTPGHSGTSAIKLTTKNIAGIGIVPGLATSGTMQYPGYNFSGGFPYTTRAQKLTGYFQWMSFVSNKDSAMIAVYLFKYNNISGNRDTIGKGVFYKGPMVMSWTAFNVNINYMSGEYPDSALIVLASSYKQSSAQVNSYLYVDDMAFSGTVAGIENISNNTPKCSIFPNPASDQIVISFLNKEKNKKQIVIADITGKIAFNGETHQEKLPVDVSGFEKGFYFYQVIDEKKEEILKGKFEVIR
ncbi:MAG: T9SS type A sorting domain-containing protein [Bacteroidetes bacterium]|nr:T9SS type A sorting domain-containing protein [Bacteroidota bacterium]